MHHLVLSYAQRRGYTDTSGAVLCSSDFSSNVKSEADAVPNQNLADLTLNLHDPTVWQNELQLFAVFLDSLSPSARLKLKPYTDFISSSFRRRLTELNAWESSKPTFTRLQSDSFSTTELQQWPFEQQATSDDDVLQLLRVFLAQHQMPLITRCLQSTEQNRLSIDVNRPEKTDITYDEEGSGDEYFTSIPDQFDESVPTIHDRETAQLLEDIKSVESTLSSTMNTDMQCPYAFRIYRVCDRLDGVCGDISYDNQWICVGLDAECSAQCVSIKQSCYATRSSVISATGLVNSVRFIDSFEQQLPDDKLFMLTASDDILRQVCLHEIYTRHRLLDYRGHTGPVWALDTAGSWFLTGAYDRTARLFTLEHRDPLRVLSGHENSVGNVLLAKNAGSDRPTLAVTTSCDGCVRLWMVNDATPIRLLHHSCSGPTALAYDEKKNQLMYADADAKVFVYDLRTDRLRQTLDLSSFGCPVNSVELSDCGQFLAAAGGNGLLKIFCCQTDGLYAEVNVSPCVELTDAFFRLKFVENRNNQRELLCLASSRRSLTFCTNL